MSRGAGAVVAVAALLTLAAAACACERDGMPGGKSDRGVPGRRGFVAFAFGNRAFVTIAGRWPRAFTVDLRSGAVLGARTLPRAQLVSPELEPLWP